MEWLAGAPNVTISVNSKLMGLIKENPTLLIIYFSGFSEYIINNPGETDGRLAGAEALLAFYTTNLDSGIKKSKEVKKLLAIKNKGELNKWVGNHL